MGCTASASRGVFSEPTVRILKLVDERYDKTLTLREAGKALDMNATYLGQLFLSETGKKFSDYVTEYRMRKAEGLICNTQHKIAYVSMACGYKNVKNFYSQFKSFFGCSPTELRHGKMRHNFNLKQRGARAFMTENAAVSALTRVFHDWAGGGEITAVSLLRGDCASFQIAYKYSGAENGWGTLEIVSPIAHMVRVRSVGLSPSAYPAPPAHLRDGGYERVEPGMFPDLLEDLEDGKFKLVSGGWRALWVDVEAGDGAEGGSFPLNITAKKSGGEDLFDVGVDVVITPVALSDAVPYHTEWFHADCLADYYNVEVFSDEHFNICENFMKTAVKRGINTILTPVFTPPLDTAEGGYRSAAQLVDVTISGGAYSFGFSKLRRWVEMCRGAGFEAYEMSHLFSQWGAKYAPVIYAEENGCRKRIFGWETAGDDERYREFLKAFLPLLRDELVELGIYDDCFFHISDEPELNDLGRYRAAGDFVRSVLPDCKIKDALSDFEFFKTGAMEGPIVALDKAAPFLREDIKDLWVYYCCAQTKNVSNRFFSTPLSRCRVLGVQMYRYDIKGFLHWGYNFYNTQFSLKKLNPYADTDAGQAFPSGDSFLVYPGEDGQPQESARLMVMDAAFRDYRALKTLEAARGREYVMNMTEDFSISAFPSDGAVLLNLRERVNREIGLVKGGN